MRLNDRLAIRLLHLCHRRRRRRRRRLIRRWRWHAWYSLLLLLLLELLLLSLVLRVQAIRLVLWRTGYIVAWKCRIRLCFRVRFYTFLACRSVYGIGVRQGGHGYGRAWLIVGR